MEAPHYPRDAPPPVFRDATPSDAPELTVMVNMAFEPESRFLKVDGRGRTDESELREMIAAGECTIICACCPTTGRVLGSVLYQLLPDAGYLGMLSVWPQLQGRGLGWRLMCEAERRATAAGRRVMRLNVINARPELFPVYERQGYAFTGAREEWNADDLRRFVRPEMHSSWFMVMEKPLA